MYTIKEPIKIVFVATGDYASLVATTALSVVENTQEQVLFYVLSLDFEEKDKTILRNFIASFENAAIDFFDIDEKIKVFDGVNVNRFNSTITYAKLLIPDIVSSNKIIYLDTDIIVNCDIKELWNIDFYSEGKEYTLAAGWDVFLNETSEHTKNTLQLLPEHKYLNTGILVINANKWREEKITPKLVKIAKELKEKILYHEQDVLNLYFDGNNYLPLDERYNSMPYFVDKKEGYNPKCYHFSWKIKPWLCNCFKSEIFWKYAHKTPYYEQLQTILRESGGVQKIKEKMVVESAANLRERLHN
jgi:lipopolysaccharide biosynthesis glycosyltransferase